MTSKGVAISPFRKEETTESGIIIPETVVEGREQLPLNQGKVFAVADDVQDIKVGDTVIYVEGTYWKNNKRVNPDEYDIDGEDLIFLKEHEIRAIVE